MKGYRKISMGIIHCSTMYAEEEDNYALDEYIRSGVHSPILEENTKSGCEEFCVVVYKKVTKK
jgi:hypothetical protein